MIDAIPPTYSSLRRISTYHIFHPTLLDYFNDTLIMNEQLYMAAFRGNMKVLREALEK